MENDRSLETTLVEVYESPSDKENGIPPVFKYKLRIFDIAEGIVIEGALVKYARKNIL